ncbi:uncharacterized protein LDX57_001000 [Aspergillus melleus]|uniref:uncharacterized protein n=1 Tax=Aspergillus melleus TaxID=138277 RepID=UPI001E8D40C8|nr:uncharacterized protein LDX57_001000 [Aspergillus melleus]KAH8423243.1 hypothetical protein LDX57_001000 [Aspergillus melleus]
MGGQNADISTETSVNAVLHILDTKGKEDTGKFFNIHVPGWENAPGLNQYDGEEIPW